MCFVRIFVGCFSIGEILICYGKYISLMVSVLCYDRKKNNIYFLFFDRWDVEIFFRERGRLKILDI